MDVYVPTRLFLPDKLLTAAKMASFYNNVASYKPRKLPRYPSVYTQSA